MAKTIFTFPLLVSLSLIFDFLPLKLFCQLGPTPHVGNLFSTFDRCVIFHFRVNNI